MNLQGAFGTMASNFSPWTQSMNESIVIDTQSISAGLMTGWEVLTGRN